MSAPVSRHSDAPQALGLAIVASSTTPMLLLDGQTTVLAASLSFASAFGVNHGAIIGAKVGSIGNGEWAVPQLEALLLATASGAVEVEDYRMDLKRAGTPIRCLLLTARKLVYLPGHVRVLLTVSDTTDAHAAERLRDTLERDNRILLQEIQHRVANSLQIIASVLMQSARRVTSEESRFHLADAHSRVMSIAALQHQLASTAKGDVSLRPYFDDLCRSIGASMIADHGQLMLKVRSDASSTSADVSVSLGLIVTELVINALKHAFPDGRPGVITVDYSSSGDGWRLWVADTGVGMPTGAATSSAGLGTAIVQALAKKLSASITIHDTNPGTTISVDHLSNADVEAVLPV